MATAQVGRSLVLIGLVLSLAGLAQPAGTCATVAARLRSVDGLRLDVADETKDDSTRLQEAIRSCPSGGVVVLAPNGLYDSFLTGAVELKAGVTLVVSKGVVLFASREARDYQVKQGSCGVVGLTGGGCRPLISCMSQAGAGLSGEGVIDGRGGERILGETFSWWDLAAEARLTGGQVNAPRLVAGCTKGTGFNITVRNPARKTDRF